VIDAEKYHFPVLQYLWFKNVEAAFEFSIQRVQVKMLKHPVAFLNANPDYLFFWKLLIYQSIFPGVIKVNWQGYWRVSTLKPLQMRLLVQEGERILIKGVELVTNWAFKGISIEKVELNLNESGEVSAVLASEGLLSLIAWLFHFGFCFWPYCFYSEENSQISPSLSINLSINFLIIEFFNQSIRS
jgi:hypothetical protein